MRQFDVERADDLVADHIRRVRLRVLFTEDESLVTVVAVLAAVINGYRGDDLTAIACPDPAGRGDTVRIVSCESDLDLPLASLVDTIGTAMAEAPVVELRRWTDEAWTRLRVDGRSAGRRDLVIEYDERRWEPTVAERALERLPRIIAESRPSRPLSVIGELTSADRRLIAEVNDTAVAFDEDLRLEALFDRQVERTPDAPALVDEGGAVTYRELDRLVDRLAGVLQERGIRPTDVVGVLVERGRGSTAAIMAVLRAGATYLPLDLNNPPDRTRFILLDADARLLFADPRTTRGWDVPCEVLDPATATTTTPVRRHSGRGGRDVAYAIYTSGSTGRPKGVLVEHRAVINRVNWMQRAYPIDDSDVVLHKTPLSFDVSVWELFWWAAHGATLCLLEPGGEKDPAVITAAIDRHGVTTLYFVPSMLDLFLDHVERVRAGSSLRTLRKVFTSGEALTPDQVSRFHRLITAETGARLVNLYGSTEATVDVSHFPCVDPKCAGCRSDDRSTTSACTSWTTGSRCGPWARSGSSASQASAWPRGTSVDPT